VSFDAMTDVAYYPRLWEFGAMAVYAGAILWLGWLVRSRWNRMGEVLPIPVALMLWAVMFALYAIMPFTFYLAMAPPPVPDYDLYDPKLLEAYAPVVDRRLTLLYWCLIFWIGPVAYATTTVVNSLAARTIDRIGPFSAHIDDPSEFAAARKLALRGDINGAVAMYRSYTDDPANALFEAARLLRSVDRFAEAASLFEEITTRFYGKLKIWAEAIYQLGKLQETVLGQADAARKSYKTLIDRAPDTRFGQLAMADLARLQVLGQDFSADDDGDAPEGPPISRSELVAAARRARMEMNAPRADDDPVPGSDPFFALRKAAAAAVDARAGLTADGPAPAKRKPAAKKKPAAAKSKASPKPAAAPKAAATPKKPSARKKKA
jgi:tetratricopeptide (TPR) repeat protein